MVSFTEPLQSWIAETGIDYGLLTCFCQHTSASLTIQENTDPAVQHDLIYALDNLAPRHKLYAHDAEGPDDMPAHIRTTLTGNTLTIPVQGHQAALGIWQGVFLIEHRDRPHKRTILLHLAGNKE